MNLTVLYEKIASLPPSLLPKVERYVDSLPIAEDEWNKPKSDDTDDHDREQKPLYDKHGNRVHISAPDHDWSTPLYDENGKKIHPQPGCLKGLITMKDNFFEPDDDWEEYM